MQYEISEFEKLVEQKYLRKAEKDNLVLYTYTEQCTYDKHWNDYTRAARGIILNKTTSEIVARPFTKFFNLGEMPETQLPNLPQTQYTVHEKLDGSLGIIFHHNNQWNIATRGSFESEQAIKATEILKQYNLEFINRETTLLVEIIYPANKIVVDYGKEEKLVLLAVINRDSGLEYTEMYMKLLPSYTGMELAKTYDYTIEQMIELQKTLPKDQEGFVVRYSNGLRLKIKGEEYLKIHKIISNLSPLSFWEVMENGKIPKEYLVQIPEEFKKDFEPIVESLEVSYNRIFLEIQEDYFKLPTRGHEPEDRKTVGLFLKDNTLKHEQAMFPMVLGNAEGLDKYIKGQIRPKGNELK